MKNRKIVLKFRKINYDIFEAIKNGKKKIETRAATKKYLAIKAGDTIIFVCGNKRIKKKIKKVELFRSITAILRKYKPVKINPKIHTVNEAKVMWYSFPGYKEKIKKHGLVAMILE